MIFDSALKFRFRIFVVACEIWNGHGLILVNNTEITTDSFQDGLSRHMFVLARTTSNIQITSRLRRTYRHINCKQTSTTTLPNHDKNYFLRHKDHAKWLIWDNMLIFHHILSNTIYEFLMNKLSKILKTILNRYIQQNQQYSAEYCWFCWKRQLFKFQITIVWYLTDDDAIISYFWRRFYLKLLANDILVCDCVSFCTERRWKSKL